MKKALILSIVMIIALASALVASLLTNNATTSTANPNTQSSPSITQAEDPSEDIATHLTDVATHNPEYPTAHETIRDFYAFHITTTGYGVPFTVRELWIDSVFTLVDSNGEVQFENAEGRIRGRGNTSWRNQYMQEKRPLRVRFSGDVRQRQMAGSEHAARDWVLRSNHMDKSLMRDYSAYFLGNLLPGMYWSPFANFVHLYVNDEYMGVYLLADERDVGPNRARLVSDPDPAVCEFFLEMDWRIYRNDAVEGVDFIRINTSPDGPREDYPPSSVSAGVFDRDHLYEIRWPGDDVLTEAHFDYVANYLTAVGLALRAGDIAEIERLVCIDSLIDYYLVQELFQNVDAGFSSIFMQIRGQGENRRLEMGPLWDFDVAAGNAEWMGNQTPYRFYVSRRWYWARAIHQTPELRERMIERWNDFFVPATLEMLAHIQQRAIDYQAAFERNFERFDILGVYVWPNPPQVVEIDTFMGQVDYLVDFLYRRMNYIDNYFN